MSMDGQDYSALMELLHETKEGVQLQRQILKILQHISEVTEHLATHADVGNLNKGLEEIYSLIRDK